MLVSALGISDFASHSPHEIDWGALPDESLVAMHWHCTPELCSFLRARGFCSIVTVRHPFDVLISILQFSKSEPATGRWLLGENGDESSLASADPTSPEFLEYALSDRAAALLAVSSEWMDQAIAVVRYENLVLNPEAVLDDVMARLGTTSLLPLPQVVARHTMEKLRPLASHHFWRGEPGLSQRLLTAEFRRAVFARHKALFERYGYAWTDAGAPSVESSRAAWALLCTPAGVGRQITDPIALAGPSS